MLRHFPATEGINALRGALIVKDDPGDVTKAVNDAQAITERTLWKQDIMVRDKGYSYEERLLMPGGHPRLVLGERAVGVEPGAKELLLAELVPRRDIISRVRVSFRALVVRVAAGAYDDARRLGEEELAGGYVEHYPTMYDAKRRILRVTSESPGVVRIYSLRDLGRSRSPRQREANKESCRLPAERIADVRELTDSYMEDFWIEHHLQATAQALKLEREYEELKARHDEQWADSN
jgi:hypothetical protein